MTRGGCRGHGTQLTGESPRRGGNSCPRHPGATGALSLCKMPNCDLPQGDCSGMGGSIRGADTGLCGAGLPCVGLSGGWGNRSRAGPGVHPNAQPSHGLGSICGVGQASPWEPDGCMAQLSHCCQTVSSSNTQLNRNTSSSSCSQRMLRTLEHVNCFTASCHKQLNVCFSAV